MACHRRTTRPVRRVTSAVAPRAAQSVRRIPGSTPAPSSRFPVFVLATTPPLTFIGKFGTSNRCWATGAALSRSLSPNEVPPLKALSRWGRTSRLRQGDFLVMAGLPDRPATTKKVQPTFSKISTFPRIVKFKVQFTDCGLPCPQLFRLLSVTQTSSFSFFSDSRRFNR